MTIIQGVVNHEEVMWWLGGGGSDYTLTPALHSGGSVVGRSVTDPVVIYVSGPCSISGAVDPDTAMGTHRA